MKLIGLLVLLLDTTLYVSMQNVSRRLIQRTLALEMRSISDPFAVTLTDPYTTDGQLSLFAFQDKPAEVIDRKSQVILSAEDKLVSKYHIPLVALERSPSWKTTVRKYCPYNNSDTLNCNSAYRTYDGSCNNFCNKDWGKSFTPQERFIPAQYDDGLKSPRQKSVDGGVLPSARKVSNIVFRSTEPPLHPSQSVLVMAWGQFLDHDLVRTPQSKALNGSDISCCGDMPKSEECFPISLQNDPILKGKTCMNFVRSAPAAQRRCRFGPREQLNSITSFIDASNVYGSTKEEAKRLRAFRKGLMKVSANDLLPEAAGSVCNARDAHAFCMDAGDGRVNVIPHLGALHIVFVREHNRLVRKLRTLNRHWDDERLYQEARLIVGAYMQHFTYNEYLPVILGKPIMKKYDILPKTSGINNKYNTHVNPSVRNVFGVAALRFGHSQVPGIQAFSYSNGRIKESFPLEDCFLDPGKLQKRNCRRSCPGITNWMVNHNCGAVDREFDEGIRDKLFQNKTANTSLDLLSLNIQRGRDHGIPSYTAWRDFLNLSKPTSFCHLKEIKSHTEENIRLLEKAYRHVDDIDLYAGAITETHLPGASVGPVFANILAMQFKALKEGDRFWYENKQININFTEEKIQAIKRVKLAKILCENMKSSEIQLDVMKVPKRVGNRRTRCSFISGLNLAPWKDLTRYRSWE